MPKFAEINFYNNLIYNKKLLPDNYFVSYREVDVILKDNLVIFSSIFPGMGHFLTL